MKIRWKSPLLFGSFILLLILFVRFVYVVCHGECDWSATHTLILDVADYNDGGIGTTKERIVRRIHVQPFNLITTFLFVCAILHTFFAHRFNVLSKRLREYNVKNGKVPVDSFGVELLQFMGEVEVIFGLWVIPLFLCLAYTYNWETALHYIEGRNYSESMFVVVIMALTSTSPIIKLAEDCLRFVAKLFGDTVGAWWWAILTIGPLVGSLITEPGAMAVSALLIGKQFYNLTPSPRLSYATLGLLFTNISVGGVLTTFAAPAVLMVRKSWAWDSSTMLMNFGWKAVMGIVIANASYYFLFRREFRTLEEENKERRKSEKIQRKKGLEIPLWICLVHVAFLAWVVYHNHYPVIFIGSFLLFLGFYQATLPYQRVLELKSAILVGLFLAGLVVHGSLQGWWIEPLLEDASAGLLLIISSVLTAFNDNAQITFLATLIPSFDDTLKYAVVAGAVTGGGLTVIANAPNPLGQSLLKRYFADGISAVALLMAALYPAVVMGLCFYLLRP